MWIAGVFLIAMIVLTCANVFLRVVWMPVRGTFELMGFFGAIVTGFAMAYTQIKRVHIAVDIVVKGISKKSQRLLNGTNCLICMIFFVGRMFTVKYISDKWASNHFIYAFFH